MEWFCSVKGCWEVAKYLRVMILDDGERIKFGLCEKHNKIKWIKEKKEVKENKDEMQSQSNRRKSPRINPMEFLL